MSGTTAAVAGIAFFLVFVAVAYVVLRMLKKTVRMAFRMALVAAVLLIAVVGSISVWWFASGSGTPQRAKPAQSRQR